MYKIIWEKWHDPLSKFAKKNGDDDDDSFGGSNGSIMITQMGILRIDPNTLASNNVNFWEGNTNFDINKKVFKAIEKVPGVETLRLLTRYKFVTSFGKSFNEEEVKRNIDKLFGTSDNTKFNRIQYFIDMVKNKNDNWAVFHLQNGTIEYYSNDNRDNVLQIIENYKKIKGTKIYTSWD